MKPLRGASALGLLALLACGGEKPPAKTSVALRSGRSVAVVASGPISFQGGGRSLMVKYETGTSFADVPALRQEAHDLWAVLQADVERQGFASAILSANTPSTGVLFERGRSYNFVFTRGPDGAWKAQ
jgi:hypothetical protein